MKQCLTNFRRACMLQDLAVLVPPNHHTLQAALHVCRACGCDVVPPPQCGVVTCTGLLCCTVPCCALCTFALQDLVRVDEHHRVLLSGNPPAEQSVL